MYLSDKQIDKLIKLIAEEAEQACRDHGKFLSDNLEQDEYKRGVLDICERLGDTGVISDHIIQHKDRILAAIHQSIDPNQTPPTDDQELHDAPISSRLRNVLQKMGFKKVGDLKNLSTERFLLTPSIGITSINELENYLGRSLSPNKFTEIEGENFSVRLARLKSWLSEN